VEGGAGRDDRRIGNPVWRRGRRRHGVLWARQRIDWRDRSGDPATGLRKWFNPPALPGPRRGFTAALTGIPGIVFAGNQGGTLRAYASGSGRIVWTFNLLQNFKTVNEVPGHGGGMGAPGPTVADGMLFVPSGYVGLGSGTAGNVLLVFG
jgi:hypothetical protein